MLTTRLLFFRYPYFDSFTLIRITPSMWKDHSCYNVLKTKYLKEKKNTAGVIIHGSRRNT